MWKAARVSAGCVCASVCELQVHMCVYVHESSACMAVHEIACSGTCVIACWDWGRYERAREPTFGELGIVVCFPFE